MKTTQKMHACAATGRTVHHSMQNFSEKYISPPFTRRFFYDILYALCSARESARFLRKHRRVSRQKKTGGFIDYGKKNEVHGRQQRCRARIVRVQ
ncbi:MAG: hypothetical protein IJQ98_03435, partial [Oscillospiraceae bacterium]|nr:hypothetical protein [Oscillospiraceae bacterium]